MLVIRDCEREDGSKGSETDLEIVPAAILMLSPQVEVRPFVVFGLHRENDPDNVMGAGVAADLTQVYLGLGAGLYYHFIQTQRISLLCGPKVQAILTLDESGASATPFDKYFDVGLNLSLPIYLDVKLTDKLRLRTGVEIPGLSYQYVAITDGVVKTREGTLVLASYWEFGFSPYFGFYYMF